MKTRIAAATALCVAGACVCFADIPGKINYQAKVTDPSGKLVSDGSYGMSFTLFDAPTGGTEKWSESHGAVGVSNGMFNVLLGSTNDLTAVFQDNASLYLEMAISGETLSPRQEVAGAPYALNIADVLKVPVGSIISYAGSAAPPGWLLCRGQAVSRTGYAALFSVIGTAYGAGDGSTTFTLPDGKGRVAVGMDGADASFDALGETGGAKTHTLTTAEMPGHAHAQDPHTHTQNAHTHVQNPHNHTQDAHSHPCTIDPGTDSSPPGNFRSDSGGGYTKYTGNATATNQAATATDQNATATNNAATATGQSTGGGEAHSILPPYVTWNYIIKY